MLRTMFRALPEDWQVKLRSSRSDVDRLALALRRPRMLAARLLRRGTPSANVGPFPSGVVSITFDDDLVDAYHKALPMMDGYGWGGTGYFLVRTLGKGLTLDQLHRMEDTHGWEIAAHGFARHANLTTLSVDEIEAELRGVRQWLVDNSFRGYRHFAYPYSGNNRIVRKLARRYFETARVVTGGAGVAMPPEPSRRHRLGAFTWGAGYASVASLTREIDRTKATGGWAILVFHGLGRPGGFSISCAEFAEILAHINALGMVVLPVGDVIKACEEIM